MSFYIKITFDMLFFTLKLTIKISTVTCIQGGKKVEKYAILLWLCIYGLTTVTKVCTIQEYILKS